MDIECPACRALPGDLCRQILVDGTSHPTESVDFHHASRVDAAFRSLTDRAKIAELTALLAEAYAGINEKPTVGWADWLRRAKESLGR